MFAASLYTQFVVHFALQRKIEYRRGAQRIGNLGYFAIHFEKLLDLLWRNDAGAREGITGYAIGLARDGEIHFQDLCDDLAGATFRLEKKPVCLRPRAKNALDHVPLSRKTFIRHRQTALEKARKLIQSVGQNIELKFISRENHGGRRENGDMDSPVDDRLQLRRR